MDSKLKYLFLPSESNGDDGSNCDSWLSAEMGSGNGDNEKLQVIL